VLVFAASQLLPGDIGRNVLGPFASPEDVERFNHMVGVDRPIWVQYWDWISHFVRGDLGTSLQYNVSVGELLGPSLVNSLQLAALAFVLVVPLSLLGGIVSALRRNQLTDRTITVTGLSLTSIPEFVTAIVLIVIFGVVLINAIVGFLQEAKAEKAAAKAKPPAAKGKYVKSLTVSSTMGPGVIIDTAHVESIAK